MKLAIVGVSGLVGSVILKVLEEHNFNIDVLIPVASEKSLGKTIEFKGEKHHIVSMDAAIAMKPDIAIFSAGSEISISKAPLFAEVGTFVIDNSSAWRMDSDKKLIVPEINANILTKEDKIIANPNCSTIQMLMPLAVLHKAYGIKRIVVSTYQSISGSGQAAMTQFEQERQGLGKVDQVYPHTIDRNCLPHCDVFLDNGYTKEEMKLVNETHKIFNDSSISVSATAVRVPVTAGHSESVNVEFNKAFEMSEVYDLLNQTEGVMVQDKPKENLYPMPLYAQSKDEVFVGRIRRDLFQENTLNMWIVADNLRKGAATNAVQIAEHLVKQGWLG
jgi:aspartate-semialdehyde dehydrogenase